MKGNKILLSLALALFTTGMNAQDIINVTVKNTIGERNDAPVVVKLNKGNKTQSAVVMDGDKEVPCQIDDLDGDGIMDEVCFTTDMKKKETKSFLVKLSENASQKEYIARTYADMMLKSNNKAPKPPYIVVTEVTADGNADTYHLQYHHGPEFESEYVGFRIYYDERQTVDLYGKYNKRLELAETTFYPSKEQKANGYGDDVLWVGNTFGAGALRGWDGTKPTMISPLKLRKNKVVASGPVRSIVDVIDEGWSYGNSKPVTMRIRYTLWAGHRDCEVSVKFREEPKGLKFSTGVINVKDSKEYTDKKGTRGCWGTDWPAGANNQKNHKLETVGLAVCVPEKYIVSEEPANKDNLGFVIATDSDELHYGIAAASANETFGIQTEKDWSKFLKTWSKEYNNPVEISQY